VSISYCRCYSDDCCLLYWLAIRLDTHTFSNLPMWRRAAMVASSRAARRSEFVFSSADEPSVTAHNACSVILSRLSQLFEAAGKGVLLPHTQQPSSCVCNTRSVHLCLLLLPLIRRKCHRSARTCESRQGIVAGTMLCVWAVRAGRGQLLGPAVLQVVVW